MCGRVWPAFKIVTPNKILRCINTLIISIIIKQNKTKNERENSVNNERENCVNKERENSVNNSN